MNKKEYAGFVKRLKSEPVVLTGVGKSFQIAQLGASLLQSVGCNAVAIHATDMLHGGLNFLPSTALFKSGVLIAISHSGETREVVDVVQRVKERVYTVGLVGSLESDLGFLTDSQLSYDIVKDGSKHGTIPAQSVMEQVRWLTYVTCEIADGMTKEQLAVGHPGGSLGRKYDGKA